MRLVSFLRVVLSGLALAAGPLFASSYTCLNSGADAAAIQALLTAGGAVNLTGPTCSLGTTTLNGPANTSLVPVGSVEFTYTGGANALNINGNNFQVSGFTFTGGGIVTTQTSGVTPQSDVTITNNTIRNISNGSNAIEGDGYWLRVNISGNNIINITTIPIGSWTSTTIVERNGPVPPRSAPCTSFTNGCAGEGIVQLNGLDNSKIEFNHCDTIFGNCIDPKFAWTTNSVPGNYSQAANVSISYNTGVNIHRMMIEGGGVSSCPPGSGGPSNNGCDYSKLLNITGLKINGNYTYGYVQPYFNTYCYSIPYGALSPQILNNFCGIGASGSPGYAFETGNKNELNQGNVVSANTAATPWDTYNIYGYPGTGYTISQQNNYFTRVPGSGNYYSFEGPNFGGTATQRYNVQAATCDVPTACETSNITTGITSFSQPSGSAVLSTWATGQLPIRNVQFFLDASPTPYASQEPSTLNANFTADRKWLYSATLSTTAITGSHTIHAVATDVSGATSTQNQNFTVGGTPSACAGLLGNCDFGTGSQSPWLFAGAPYGSFAVSTPGACSANSGTITAASIVPPGNNIELYQDGLTLPANGSDVVNSFTASVTRQQQVHILGILQTSPFTNYGLDWTTTLFPGCHTYFKHFLVSGSPAASTVRWTIQTNNVQVGDEINISDVLLGPSPTSTMSITNLVMSNTDHASINMQFDMSGPGYPYIRYGTASGAYLWTSASWNEQFNAYSSTYHVSYQISGLNPSTDFWALPTIRPNPDDDINICDSISCGAVEQSWTTLALPTQHPQPPAEPTVFNPDHPDFSAYTVIPMIVGGSGDYVAATNVAAPGGGGWVGSVTAGDNLQTVYNEIGYGTRVQLPQSTSGKIISTDSTFHRGITLPALALDPMCGGDINSPSCRWIVTETVDSTGRDFPPYRTQVTSDWSSKLAKLIVQTPGSPTDGTAPGFGGQNLLGQIFDIPNNAEHHFWFQNLEWTHLNDSTTCPSNNPDPPGFDSYYASRVIDGSLAPSTTPNYNVIDRVYAHGQPWPCREVSLVVAGGNNIMITGSDLSANMWWPGAYPTTDPTYAANVISVPAASFKYNFFDAATIPVSPVTSTATFTVPGGYTGQFIGWIDSGGTFIGYQTGAGVSLACSGCTGVPLASPSLGSPGNPPSWPSSAMLYFYGHFNGSGTAVQDYSIHTSSFAIPGRAIIAFRPLGYLWQGGSGHTFINSSMMAIGQGIYNDPDNPRNNNLFQRLYLYFPREKMRNSGVWDGFKYTYRNIWESKQNQLTKIIGNHFNGSSAYQNAGNLIYVLGAGNGPNEALAGSRNILVDSNLAEHISAGWACSAGGSDFPPDHGVIFMAWTNNLLVDLNRDLYNDGTLGFLSGPFAQTATCEDVDISHNTVAMTKGQGPAMMTFGANGNGTTTLGEGGKVADNIMIMSMTNQDVQNVLYSLDTQQTPSHPANPADIKGSDVTPDYVTMLNGSFIHTSDTVVPNWFMQRNAIIGGVNTGAAPTYTDLTGAQVTTVSNTFPAGNTFAAGNTLADRLGVVKWQGSKTTVADNAGLYGFKLDYGSAYDALNNPFSHSADLGVDMVKLYREMGKITIVSTPNANITTTGFTVFYDSSNSNPCYLSVSPYSTDPKAVSPSVRIADTDGLPQSSIAVTGLTTKTLYAYRLACEGNAVDSQIVKQVWTN